jgi:methionine-rich copper-binding protein CopC
MRIIGWKVVLVVLCLLVPALGHAHALLKKSEPAQRAQVSRPPAAVRLWFNERLESAFSTITVLDASGAPVSQDKATLSPQDAGLLELRLPALPAGEYTVRYQVMSVDGHTVTSSYTFRVKDATQ